MKPTYKTTNHWRKMWSRHPDRMRANLEAINVIQGMRAEQRQTRLRGVLRLVADTPMSPSKMRDHIAEAWLASFSEELDAKKAWLEVRFGLRCGLIVREPDGLYKTRLDT